MDLLQLKYFCDAAKSENFSKTAAKFRVPASNISQTVSRLEKELGVSLFDRFANSIALNENGKLFYEHISAGLEKIEDGKRILSENSEEITGEIHLQIFTNRRIVTQAIEKFRLLYPHVSFVLNHSINRLSGSDLLISDFTPDEKGLTKHLLVREDILLAVSNGNPLSKKSSLSVSDLKNERFISMPKGSSMHKITTDICIKNGFVPNISIMTDDPFYIRKYIELGLGIALVPSFSWKGQFSENVTLKNIGAHKRNTYIYYNSERYMSKAVSEFLRLLINLS